MRQEFTHWAVGCLVLPALLLTPIRVFAQAAPGNAPAEAPKKCKDQADPKLGFVPRAITLTPINVRTAFPEYSFVKGRWVFGGVVEVLPPETCLAILDRQDVGVIQIWYLVRYKDRSGQMKSGWVWGGTIEKDENAYIGGDRTVPPKKSSLPQEAAGGVWAFLIGTAHAASAAPPAEPGSQEATADKTQEFLVFKIPGLAFPVTSTQFSAFCLFGLMVVGMMFKAMWDETERGKVWPSRVQVVRPLLISPIAFSAFWGTMYIQTESPGLSLTMALYAFQIGFMWQHVLEKRIEAEKHKNTGKPADVIANDARATHPAS